MKKIFFLLFFLICFSQPNNVFAQDTLFVSLNEVLEIAQKKSLDAFKNQNLYMASYWQYRAYRSSLLPQINTTIRPFTFNRSLTQRYDSETNTDVFREQQTLNSYVNLAAEQNIGLTGGRIYLDTDFNSLSNFNLEDGRRTFSFTPVRIGLVQPIFGFNQTKWNHLIEPIKYKQAKQNYLSDLQAINIKVVGLYFDLVLAIVSKEIAIQNLQSAKELYDIGVKRFNLTSIDKETLLNLELTQQNSEIALVTANKDIARAEFNLKSFLILKDVKHIIPEIPQKTLTMQVNPDEAVTLAFEANPDPLLWKQKKLEAEMNLDQVTKENNINIDLTASYGLNKQTETLNNTFQDLLNQEMVAINISMPLLDWGERKGLQKVSLNEKEVVEIEIKQEQLDFEQEVILKVIDFNLQEQLVSASAKAVEIATATFELTNKRFRNGQTDVLNLNSSREAKETARQNYVNSLKTYWIFYYELQELTLYDFISQKPLEEKFEQLINSLDR